MSEFVLKDGARRQVVATGVKVVKVLTGGAKTYSAGDSIGGVQELEVGGANAAGVLLQSISVIDAENHRSSLGLVFFDNTVSGNTDIADGNAFDLSVGDDLGKVVGVVKIDTNDYVSYDSDELVVATKTGIGLVMAPASDKAIRVAIIDEVGHERTAANTLQIDFGFLQG